MPKNLRDILLICCAALFADAAAFAEERHNIRTEPDSNVKITVVWHLNRVPTSGFMPVTVEVVNNNDRLLSYTLSWESTAGYYGNNRNIVRTSRVFKIPGKTAEAFDFVLPLAQNSHRWGSNYNARIEIAGEGVADGQAYKRDSYSHHSSPSVPAHVGISDKLRDYMHLVTSGSSGHGPDAIVASQLNPDYLPSDWRGYTGLTAVFITTDELAALRTLKKKALTEWISSGGQLFILSNLEPGAAGKAAGLDLPDDSANTYQGFGEVHFIKADFDDHPIRAQVGGLMQDATKRHRSDALASRVAQQYGPSVLKIGSLIESPGIGTGFILAFMIIFGIVVGPVNLMILARGSKRYRLFFTTPLIAIATSGFLVAYITLKDGVGGEGAYVRLLYHDGLKNQLSTQQEQVTQTYMLLNRTFDLADTAALLNIRVHDGHGGGSQYQITNDSYSGDWYRNRERQYNFLTDVRTSRNGLTLTAPELVGEEGGAPTIQSSVEGNIKTLYYRDNDDNLWTVDSLGTGQKRTLRRATKAEFNEWMTAIKDQASQPLNMQLGATQYRKDHYYAEVEDLEVKGFETLSSIDWQLALNVLIGTPEKGAGAQ